MVPDTCITCNISIVLTRIIPHPISHSISHSTSVKSCHSEDQAFSRRIRIESVRCGSRSVEYYIRPTSQLFSTHLGSVFGIGVEGVGEEPAGVDLQVVKFLSDLSKTPRHFSGRHRGWYIETRLLVFLTSRLALPLNNASQYLKAVVRHSRMSNVSRAV